MGCVIHATAINLYFCTGNIQEAGQEDMLEQLAANSLTALVDLQNLLSFNLDFEESKSDD